MSFFQFFRAELSRDYELEHNEERYEARREKVYTFAKIPREMEKFMCYGFFQCADSFLFLFTFLPIRFAMAIVALVVRPPLYLLGLLGRRDRRIMRPSEIIDILKGCMILGCYFLVSYLDMAKLYHIIKTQSVIKLYLIFNMLEVCDRLLSVFGQDIVDVLYWTATENKKRKREHYGTILHLLFAVAYVYFHTGVILIQATTLNVAINSRNLSLLTIMLSNNFVELKSSVFKKFDKRNLFLVACADVRERFHLIVLLGVVVVQTMREYTWTQDSFWVLLPVVLIVYAVEIVVDWLKHAFVTRFNEIPVDVYREYTLSLAYDLAATKSNNAFSDHSDLVARRMGFLPLPLGILAIRIVAEAVDMSGPAALVLLALAYLALVTLRILLNIVSYGKACDLLAEHAVRRQQSAAAAAADRNNTQSPTVGASSPRPSRSEKRAISPSPANEDKVVHNDPEPLQRSVSTDSPTSTPWTEAASAPAAAKVRSVSSSPPRLTKRRPAAASVAAEARRRSEPPDCQPDCHECTDCAPMLFSDSTVSLQSVGLNEALFEPLPPAPLPPLPRRRHTLSQVNEELTPDQL